MLSRRWIINYLLVALIIVFAYVGNHFDLESGSQPQRRITKLKSGEVESIDIQSTDSTLALKREGNSWKLEIPIRWPANSVSVGRLLNIVNSETVSRLDADETDLDTLGLQTPKATMRLNDTEILFGTTSNIGGRRYTMIGSAIYLLADVHLPFISQGLAGIIDRRLLPHSFELAALEFPGFEIIRDNQSTWRLNTADGYEQGKIDGLVENWQYLEASSVKPYAAGAPSQQKIALRLRNGQNHEFLVLSTDPEIIIANPQIGMQYHFPTDLYYQLISLHADENSG